MSIANARVTDSVRPEPESTTGITATALGTWPGTAVSEANRIIRGELGSPNLPHLVELPDRGVGADAVGRTAAMLVDLAVDLQPHGWRMVPRSGREHRRALSFLDADINDLAEVIGGESTPARELKVQLRGPVSLAADLYVHNGERLLRDSGARSELTQSLAAGAADHVCRVAALARGARIIVQLDEPHAARVLAGTIPTASGYRTLRAVRRSEAVQSWTLMAEALRAAGAQKVVAAITGGSAGPDGSAIPGGSALLGGTSTADGTPGAQEPLGELASSLDGIAVPLRRLSRAQWEFLAEYVESGGLLWPGVADVHGGLPPQVSDMVEQLHRPWRTLGLSYAMFSQLRLTPNAGLAGAHPDTARTILGRLSSAADALNQVAADK